MGSKKRKNIPNYNPNPPAAKNTIPTVTSVLDVMQDGQEYASILGLQNVNIDLRSELLRSMNEITSIRKRPLICYIANVINPNITQSISIDNSDDAPFMELIRSIDPSEKNVDIMLVTPGGSAETVSFLVNQLRNKFDSVAFILP